MRRTANSSFRNEVGVIYVKNINFASRPYFSEQGNVDDDATFITIHSIYSLAASCSLQPVVCKCHTPRWAQLVSFLCMISNYCDSQIQNYKNEV